MPMESKTTKAASKTSRASAPASAAAVAASPPPAPAPPSPASPFCRAITAFIRAQALLLVFFAAVTIRLGAVRIYGRVIHEFDPWFNFRATKYLEEHGWAKFSTWYDYESWYPLGRPVGTTTYPGMMVTAVAIFRAIGTIGPSLGLDPVTLNDVCVFIPAGFAVLTCIFTYGLAYEATRSSNVALASAGIMAILPAHLMRSVAGGFDNESMAVAAICATFFFWTRALRSDASWPYAFVCAASYIYMVATWGGYTFVLNMIGVHTAVLLLTPDGGGFTRNLHRCYTIWYLIGTAGAVQFPIVGWQPLQSMEQLGPLGVFLLLQLLWIIDVIVLRCGKEWEPRTAARFKRDAIAVALGAGAIAVGSLLPEGFVGPLSARIRGLFVRHTRTGNPLVDSVAEHQATPPTAYLQYFHNVCLLGPIGALALFLRRGAIAKESRTARKFVLLYLFLACYFSGKMIRLVLLLSPAASIVAGYVVASVYGWAFKETFLPVPSDMEQRAALSVKRASDAERARVFKAKREARVVAAKNMGLKNVPYEEVDDFEPILRELKWEYSQWRILRKFIAIGAIVLLTTMGLSFHTHSWRMAGYLSEPQVMMRTRNGEIIDDFREAYHWLRDKTPEDSRVMAWWDYGYQINGIANRTTIADGNTWNHEHIALLGRALVSSEETGHAIARHLADFVLIWTTRFAEIGANGDDLAKSPHMARIAGSVFADINPKDFFMNRDGTPSSMMKESLLYRLHAYKLKMVENEETGDLEPELPEGSLEYFEEVYTTSRKMVRIYRVKKVSRKSKEWCNEAKNRELDGRGKYPPAIESVLTKMKAFQRQ